MIDRIGGRRRGDAESATRCRIGALILAVSSAALLVLAPTAPAAQKYQQLGMLSGGNFSFLSAESVAVNDKNGHIYVADSGRGQVLDYTSASDTSPTAWSGSTTPSGSFGEHISVAVDNASGDVYVADRSHKVIDKFDEDGNLIASFGDTEPTPGHHEPNGQLAGLETPAHSFSPPSSYYSSFGIAVDQATHDLYVLDAGHKVVDIFDETGAYLRQITATPEHLYREGGEYATGLAVNSSGTVFVADWGGPNLLFEFDSSGNYVSTWNGGALPNGAASETPEGDFSGECNGCYLISVATEDAAGKIFVGSEAHGVVDVFDGSGDFMAPQVTGIRYPSAVSVDQSTGDLFVSEYSAVYIFKAAVVPNVTLSAATEETASTAQLHGHVDPATGEGGGSISTCKFEFITNTAFEENTRENGLADPWKGAGTASCEPSSLPYTTPMTVSAQASGLQPGTEYHERLTAGNAEGNNSAVSGFATAGTHPFSKHVGSTGSGDGQFKEPHGVAIDAGNGDLYVADTGNHRIVKLDPAGNFLAAWGWGVTNGTAASQVCTSGCQAGISGSGAGQFESPYFVAVDNSDGASAGDVYVADTGDKRVQKFDPSGSLINSWGTNGAKFYAGGIAGIAVSAAGNLIVEEGSPTGIGVDRFGNVYGGWVALDNSTGDSYYEEGGSIHEYAASSKCAPNSSYCAPADAFGFGELKSATGLAFNESTEVLYVANTGEDDVAVFTPLPVPSVATLDSTEPGLTSATLNGRVTPDGAGNITDCHFEYGTSIHYGNNVPCSPAVSSAGTTEVHAEVSGLLPFVSYHYRLVVTAENDLGLSEFGEDLSFTTNEGLSPVVDGTSFSELSTNGVTLSAQITPNLAPTIYRFQYGPTTSYGLQTLPSESIGEDQADHLVFTAVTGLSPATTYHFRVVAVNFDGKAIGSDQTFTTPAAPTVTENPASELTQTGATLSADIRPGFRPTTYHFEYGRTDSYGHSTPESGSIGADNGVYAVQAGISELAPEATYHFHVVATNAAGTAAGPDLTFTTASVPVERSREETEPVAECKKGFVRKHGKCVRKRVVKRRHGQRNHRRGGEHG